MPPEQAEDKTPTLTCPSCGGSGREFDHDATGGHYTDCRDCKGAGKVRDLAKNAIEGGLPAPTSEQVTPAALRGR